MSLVTQQESPDIVSTSSKKFNQYFEEFDKVHHHKRKQLEELSALLTERMHAEAAYAKALQKVATFKLNYLLQSPLVDVAETFISNADNKYAQLLEFIDTMKEEVVQPLDNILRDQKDLNRMYFQEGKNVVRSIMDSAFKLEQIKTDYLTVSKEANDLMEEYEGSKMVKDFNKIKRDQIFRQMNSLMRESENKEMLYRQQIKQTNNYKDRCIETLAGIIKNYEDLEAELYQTQLDSINKLNIFETSLTRNVQYDTKDLAALTENLTVEEEIKFQRQQDYFKKVLMYDDYSFKTYEETLTLSNCTLLKKEESDQINPAEQDLLWSIVNDIFDAKDVKKQQLDQFASLVQKKEARAEFLACLTSKSKNQNSQIIDQKTYVNMCYLFTVTLSEIHKQQDTSSILKFIEHSRDFYTMQPPPSKPQGGISITPMSRPRTFITHGINKHLIWLDYDFWEKIIFDYLREESRKYNQLMENDLRLVPQEEQEYSIRVKQMVFTHLSSLEQDMLSFEVPKKKVKEIIHHFSSVHGLTRDQISQLMHKIDAFGSSGLGRSVNTSAAQAVRGVPDWLQELEGLSSTRPSHSFSISDILSTRNSDISGSGKLFETQAPSNMPSSHLTVGNVFTAFTMNKQKKPYQIQRSPSQALHLKGENQEISGRVSSGKKSFGESSPGQKKLQLGNGQTMGSGSGAKSFIRTEEITFEEESQVPLALSKQSSLAQDSSIVIDQVIQ